MSFSLDGVVVAASWGDVLLLPFLVGYAAWWAHDLHKGSAVHGPAVALHVFVYGVLAVWVWFISIGELIDAGAWSGSTAALWSPWLPIVTYLAVAAGLRYGRTRLAVTRSAAGQWIYRSTAAVPVIWLVLWFVRLGLESVWLGGYSVFFPTTTLHGSPPAGVALPTFVVVLSAIVLLYEVSFGLMLGFTFQISARYRAARRAVLAPSPAAPLVDPRNDAFPNDLGHWSPTRSAGQRLALGITLVWVYMACLGASVPLVSSLGRVPAIVLVPFVLAALPTALMYHHDTQRERIRAIRWAPDRIAVRPEGIVAYYDRTHGPGGRRLALVPFPAVYRVEPAQGLSMVVTSWWHPPASRKLLDKSWKSPPSVAGPTGATVPGAVMLRLSPENGQRVVAAWSAWRQGAPLPLGARPGADPGAARSR